MCEENLNIVRINNERNQRIYKRNRSKGKVYILSSLLLILVNDEAFKEAKKKLNGQVNNYHYKGKIIEKQMQKWT